MTSTTAATGHDHPAMWENTLSDSTLITPVSSSDSAIMMSGANQMRASHAGVSARRSFQVMTRHSKIAESPASDTNALGTECQGDVTQPAMTHNIIAINQRSRALSGPMR